MKEEATKTTNHIAEKKRKKRETIISVAIKLLSENGYANTKIKDIAAEARVADGTIYTYFTSKEDLMMSALTETLRNKLIEVKKISAQESDVRAKILKFFDFHAIIF